MEKRKEDIIAALNSIEDSYANRTGHKPFIKIQFGLNDVFKESVEIKNQNVLMSIIPLIRLDTFL